VGKTCEESIKGRAAPLNTGSGIQGTDGVRI
jgi:hypothetical protein